MGDELPKRCPCGAGGRYDRCCGRLHRGERRPAEAVEVVRARYSAFVVRDEAYLLASWHSSTRPPEVAFDDDLRWQGLHATPVSGGGPLDREGVVDLSASYATPDGRGVLQERSGFAKEDGAWRYVGPLPD